MKEIDIHIITQDIVLLFVVGSTVDIQFVAHTNSHHLVTHGLSSSIKMTLCMVYSPDRSLIYSFLACESAILLIPFHFLN